MSVWAWLIERLERATAGERAIDWDMFYEVSGISRFDKYAIAPNYTASLDAARTLVPEEWRVEHIGEQLSGGRWDVELHWREYSMDACLQSNGATPAVALCIAALKARVSHGVDEPG